MTGQHTGKQRDGRIKKDMRGLAGKEVYCRRVVKEGARAAGSNV